MVKGITVLKIKMTLKENRALFLLIQQPFLKIKSPDVKS